MIKEYFDVIYNKINSYFSVSLKEEGIIKIVNNCEIIGLNDNLMNKILMNLVEIKLENTDINSRYYEQYGDNYVKKIKPLFFNIFIYFHSTFCSDETNEGLYYLSEIISYFHTNSIFNEKNTEEITEKKLSQFNSYIVNVDIDIYKLLKIPYMPSVLIKFGLIPVGPIDTSIKEIPSIKSF